MKYLLDTNICIHFFRGQFSVDKKLNTIGIENCAISEITLAELMFGAENSSDPAKNKKLIDKFITYLTILPIFDAIPEYAKQKTKLRKKGIMISDFDLFIGCTALENSLIMVTENTKEFERIKGLKIENWIQR